MRGIIKIIVTTVIAQTALLALPGQAKPQEGLLARRATAHVRVMTWNIGANSIFEDPGPRGFREGDGKRPARFKRIARALAPDVFCLQEVFTPRTAADVGALLDATLPLERRATWQVQQTGDTVIASRFPLSMRAGRQEDFGGGVPRAHTMALIDLPEDLGRRDLYVLCAHLQSRGEAKDIAARQRQADAIATWIRDLRTPGGEVDLPSSTPLVLLGDWNAYKTDPAHHITTLLTGAIVDSNRFGKGMPPDWDATPLRDSGALHNGLGPASFTFGAGAGEHPPAALDRVLFTDSVLEAVNAFVLNTTTLAPAVLSELGMEEGDVLLNAGTRRFDHLPVVVDFRLSGAASRRQ